MNILQTMQAFQAAGQQVNQIKQMMNLIKSSRNPQVVLNQMVMSNPQLKQAMDYVQNNGGDAKKAFYTLAKEKGVNPDDILKQLM